MGFPGYFLIVADFINWAQTHGCPVGPGRGSGAGSLVAYSLNITGLDPLRYELLFERFLNPERVSMPDFDIDFCQANRDRVIDYVKAKYGRDAVSQIATFGTMAAKAALRDIGRVLGMSYGHVDSIAKLVPAPPGKTVTLKRPPERPTTASSTRAARRPRSSSARRTKTRSPSCSRSPSAPKGWCATSACTPAACSSRRARSPTSARSTCSPAAPAR